MFSNSLVFLLKKRREVSPPKSHVDLPRLIDSKESGTLLLLAPQLSKRTLLTASAMFRKTHEINIPRTVYVHTRHQLVIRFTTHAASCTSRKRKQRKTLIYYSIYKLHATFGVFYANELFCHYYSVISCHFQYV